MFSYKIELTTYGIKFELKAMKINMVYESKLRASKFKDLDVARKAVKEDVLTADYVIDLMVDRGVLEIMEDGSVKGVSIDKQAKAEGGHKNTSLDWKRHWPKKASIMQVLAKEPMKFRELQAKLAASGDVSSHWLTLHAIWFLEKAGDVVKDGKAYRLAGHAAVDNDVAFADDLTEDDRMLIEACLKVGGGYKLNLVAEELAKAYTKKGVQWTPDKAKLTGEIEFLEEAGHIPIGVVDEEKTA